MELTHVIVGPAEHGVTEYARALYDALGASAPCVTAESVAELDAAPGSGSGSTLAAATALHVTFTDHLFGSSPNEAVDTVLRLAGERPLSVSFHDIPQPEEGADRFARRAGAYRRLARRAHVAVVNSEHEAAFFAADDTDSENIDVRVIRLPLPHPAPDVTAGLSPAPDTFGLIGFVYPGKGHQRVIESLERGAGTVVALGKCSAGHEYMADELQEEAARRGIEFELTGFLSDSDMWRRMAQVAVPVCAHHHFSASGSLMRWLAAGRRVLVADSAYAREMDREFPGLITLVGDDEWPQALRRAAADPEFSTPQPAPRWAWSDVAAAWRRAWEKGLWPRVSAIIPHYNAPAQLAEVIAGLEAQDYPGHLEVVVADDGSATLPSPTTRLPLTVVAQEDQGFRAAAARNLGAAHADGDIFCFLDGDTVPRPEYVRHAIAPVLADAHALVVGARYHDGAQAQWLADAYRRTDNLTAADDSAYRFVISAVLTCSRELFEQVLFDASMVGYGGEDWEFAYRAQLHGARLVHAPGAIADHREPDWEERTGIDVAEKNAESVALAHRVAHPSARPDGVIFRTADVEVCLPEETDLHGKNGTDLHGENRTDLRGVEETPGLFHSGVREALIISWLNAGSGNLHVIADAGESADLFSADPRVHPDHRDGARWQVVLTEAFAPSEPLAWDDLAPGPLRDATGRVVGEVRKTSGAATSSGPGLYVDGEILRHPIRLERYFAGW